MRVTVLDIARDEAARNQTTRLRYEVVDGDDHRTADRSWRLHWFEQDDFAQLCIDARLETRSVRRPVGDPTTSHATAFTVVLGPRSG